MEKNINLHLNFVTFCGFSQMFVIELKLQTQLAHVHTCKKCCANGMNI